MRWLLILAVTLTAGLLRAGDQDELKKLEGTWNILSAELGGKKAPDEYVVGGTLTIKGDKYTLRFFKQVADEGTIKVDPVKKPKTWDKVSSKLKDVKIAGVYELEGDALRFCESAAGQERPKEINSKAGTLETSTTLKRKK